LILDYPFLALGLDRWASDAVWLRDGGAGVREFLAGRLAGAS
jgi:hypothetical protein